MNAQFDVFEERTNKFFNSMLQDINPKVYAISTDRFVFVNKSYFIKGYVTPNAQVSIYINGVLNSTAIAQGDGSFQASVRPVNDENVVTVEYV